jgi:hypothetical protein
MITTNYSTTIQKVLSRRPRSPLPCAAPWMSDMWILFQNSGLCDDAIQDAPPRPRAAPVKTLAQSPRVANPHGPSLG